MEQSPQPYVRNNKREKKKNELFKSHRREPNRTEHNTTRQRAKANVSSKEKNSCKSIRTFVMLQNIVFLCSFVRVCVLKIKMNCYSLYVMHRPFYWRAINNQTTKKQKNKKNKRKGEENAKEKFSELWIEFEMIVFIKMTKR